MQGDQAPDADEDKQVLYLTTLRCQDCGNETTYPRVGPAVPMDQDPPWPDDVLCCPECATYYPDDLGVAITEVAEAERYAPEERGR